MPRVDIITPTYRRRQALAEYLQALAAQTYRDFRLILINDGGPSVAGVVAGFPGLPVTLLEPAENRGHAAARNAALTHATAELIALCDDDDLWLTTHLEQAVQTLDATGAGLVYAGAELVRMVQTPQGRVPGERRRFAFPPDPTLLRRWNTIISSGCVYRRALHQRHGPFDAAMGDYWDWDWFLTLTAAGVPMARVPGATVLVAVDAGGGNASAVPERMRVNLERLIRKHGLGPLPSSNFWRMLDEPELRPLLAPD